MGEPESIFETALARFTSSLSTAFRPLLDPVSIRHELDRPLYDFLGTEALFAREHVFEQLDVPNALWAIRCWTTLADGDEQPKATVLPISDVKFVKLPSYTDVEVAPGKTEPCLSAGRVLLERSGRRCVIEIRERTRTLYEELVVELIVADGSRHGDTIAADFEAALRRYDPNRGQHLTFDKAGLRFLDPPDVTWDDVVLPEAVKEEIRRNVTTFLRAHRDGSSPILPPSRSLLLSGPPGTGKTLVGKALTSELEGITFLWVTPGGFDHFGDSGYFFRWARERTPAVCSSKTSTWSPRSEALRARSGSARCWPRWTASSRTRGSSSSRRRTSPRRLTKRYVDLAGSTAISNSSCRTRTPGGGS